MGTLVGVLPGLGPAAAISLLLPLIFHAEPVGSLIMLAGICYGAQYGGAITSILINIPGEASSIVTCFDGYQMARKGRAGAALGISAIGSFIAGTFGVVGLMLFAPIMAKFALRFGPPEYFSLTVMSLLLVTYVTKGSLLKSLIMACLGVIMSVVGMDPMTSRPRFTFGVSALLDGFDLIYVAMGMFGMAEVLNNLSQAFEKREMFETKIKNLLPNLQDWKDSAMPIVRGTITGFFLGIIPGFGNLLPTFVSYAMEKKLSKYPEKFGTGVIQGVAGPEATNNASSSATFIPMLSLGIPTNPSTAIILGALMILGLQPGPMLIASNPNLFWGVIASMYVGNVMLVILNLPMIGLWVRILKIPYSMLYVFIILFCQIGAYSVNNSVEGILLVNIFALVGFLVKRYGFEPAPLLLGLVLGPLFETGLRRSLLLSDGSAMIFVTRPLSAVFLLVALVFLLSPLFSGKRLGENMIARSDD